jgi:O-antigen ligase
VLIVGILFFVLFVNICKDYGAKVFFLKIRKLFLYSLIVVFSCGFIEYLIVTYNYEGLIPFFKLYNYLPFVEVSFSNLNRVASITYEPPALGTYLITISPFMFSYMISEKKGFGFIPFLLVIILAIFSKSRTVFVVAIIQTILAIYLYYKAFPRFRNFFTKFILISSSFGIVVLIIFWNPIKDAFTERIQSLDITKTEYSAKDNSVSNKSRLGIQYAMFHVYKENPVFGVGWGQQTFESKNHYPVWATDRNWEFSTKYLNEDIKSFPPGYNMYLRILTETGLIGFLVFIGFIYIIIRKSYFAYNSNKSLRYISITLIISFYGMFLNWLQIDSFGLYGFWISFAILVIFNKNINEQNSSSNTSL